MSEAQVEVLPVEIDVPVEVKNIIETLIFACDEPMTVRMIRGIVDEANKERLPHEQLTVNAEIIRKAVGDLNRGYARLGSGFRIVEIAGGFIYATQEQFATWVGKLAKEKARRRLSPTAVETLAIIAYKQPITKVEVEFIRGVNVDYIINALLEKDLIHITGRQNTPGRPLLYGTTQKFLEHFGLNELTDLPKPREIAELINETELEVDRRLLAEQQELEFREGLENKLEGHEGAAKKEKVTKQPKVKIPEEIATERIEKDREKVTTTQESDVSVINESPSEEQSVVGIIEEQQTEVNVQTTVEQDVLLDNEISNSETEFQSETVSEQENLYNGIQTENVPERSTEIFGEEGAELSINHGRINEINHPDQSSNKAPRDTRNENEQESNRQSDPQSGWSTWKNKVKTFFKKLFG
ncbi:MAG: SMC-Scp complex subunit ScpB [Ignavibacteriales bacterium]|nr:SMC-Scp complex subunit ScpB [Ignavibacteriales bacterium]